MKEINLYPCFDNWKLCENIFLYSDTHFGDVESFMFRNNITEVNDVNALKRQLEEFDLMQIKNINSKCGKNSCLIILGDVGNIECVKKLKAKYKILIIGNHDKGASNYKRIVKSNDDNHLFDEVYEGPLMISEKLMLSHEPVDTPSYIFNIHGHVHNTMYKGDSHHLNVCAESINYTPISLVEILRRGLLSNIDSIHRETIDRAILRKKIKPREEVM